MDELAAQEIGTVVVQQHRGDVVLHAEPAVLVRRQVVRIGRPRPRIDGDRRRAARHREFGGRQAGPARGTEMGEQAQLDAKVDQPGPMEPAEAPDQVVEAVVVAHAPIVAWSRDVATAGVGVPFGDATVPGDSRF